METFTNSWRVDNYYSAQRTEAAAKTLGLSRPVNIFAGKKKLIEHRMQTMNYNDTCSCFKFDAGRNEKFLKHFLQFERNPRSSGLALNKRSRPIVRGNIHAKSDKIDDASAGKSGGANSVVSLLEAASCVLGHASGKLQVGDLGREIAVLALPAVIAQAVDPMAQLMETAYIGRIGAVELGAVGISISIFNLLSKMFNVPLLNITTSFVAVDDASSDKWESDLVEKHSSDKGGHGILKGSSGQETDKHEQKKRVIPAVSAALLLGAMLGVIEASALALGAGVILNVMGVPAGSPMRVSAERYLAVRAVGAPAVVVALAVQGVFRGLKDTKTPLYATVAGNISNILLDPILMFVLSLGLHGAALATVASQYCMAFLLIWNLGKRVILLPLKLADFRLHQFMKSGGLLLGRTVALLLTMTLATSMAARQGTISMAGHQILLQIWLATSLLSDAIALAGQAMIASAFAKGNFGRVQDVTFRILQMGLGFGLFLAVVLYVGLGPISKLFTSDRDVLRVLAQGIPFVAFTQPLNALAFVFDGIHYGASDFAYAAYSMMVISILSSVCLVVAPSFLGLPGVWLGLTLVMTLRVVAGFIRLGTASGPWQFLNQQISVGNPEIHAGPILGYDLVTGDQ